VISGQLEIFYGQSVATPITIDAVEINPVKWKFR
jgi:hypothetical protein